MQKNTKLICFPGWACTTNVNSWMGMPARCVTHLEQMAHFQDPVWLKKLLPKEDWILVTWSMGTWMGLELAKVWGPQAPRHWIALSAFTDFLQGNDRVSSANFETLLRSFDQQPQKTLEKFQKRNGALRQWYDPADFKAGDWDQLKKSLHILGHHPPKPTPIDDCPLTAITGQDDKLVTHAMSAGFCQYFAHFSLHMLEDASHSLFYEEPASVRSIVEPIFHA